LRTIFSTFLPEGGAAARDHPQAVLVVGLLDQELHAVVLQLGLLAIACLLQRVADVVLEKRADQRRPVGQGQKDGLVPGDLVNDPGGHLVDLDRRHELRELRHLGMDLGRVEPAADDHEWGKRVLALAGSMATLAVDEQDAVHILERVEAGLLELLLQLGIALE
jgi:hypothetical protein